jgi:large subunit ribosomal protein L13
MNIQRTFIQKPADVQRAWHVVDVAGKVLGKVAADIAVLLTGKDKVTYTPHVDSGDFVVVINAAQVVVTGRKSASKIYRRHSGFPGGLNEQTFAEVLTKHPERIIEEAVSSMLPKNKLRTDRMARLKVYPAAEHPHESQVKGGATKAA